MAVQELEILPALPEETTIWRFMIVAKLLSLLTTQTLYFAQLSKLREMDPFEGQYGKVNLNFAEKFRADASFAKFILDRRSELFNARSVCKSVKVYL